MGGSAGEAEAGWLGVDVVMCVPVGTVVVADSRFPVDLWPGTRDVAQSSSGWQATGKAEPAERTPKQMKDNALLSSQRTSTAAVCLHPLLQGGVRYAGDGQGSRVDRKNLETLGPCLAQLSQSTPARRRPVVLINIQVNLFLSLGYYSSPPPFPARR